MLNINRSIDKEIVEKFFNVILVKDDAGFKQLLNDMPALANEKTSLGIYPVSLAIKSMNVEALNLLVSLKDKDGNPLVDIDKEDHSYYNTNITKIENLEMFKLLFISKDGIEKPLLNVNAKINICGIQNLLLIKAIYDNNLEAIKLLIEGKEPVIDINERIYTVILVTLTYATHPGNLEIFHFLFGFKDVKGKKLLDINKNIDGATSRAIINMNLEALKMLLSSKDENGKALADMTKEISQCGGSYLDYATHHDRLDIFKFLLELKDENGKRVLDVNKETKIHPPKNSVLVKCIYNNNQQALKILFDLKDKNGNYSITLDQIKKTTLSVELASANKETQNFLLDHIKIRDHSGVLEQLIPENVIHREGENISTDNGPSADYCQNIEKSFNISTLGEHHHID